MHQSVTEQVEYHIQSGGHPVVGDGYKLELVAVPMLNFLNLFENTVLEMCQRAWSKIPSARPLASDLVKMMEKVLSEIESTNWRSDETEVPLELAELKLGSASTWLDTTVSLTPPAREALSLSSSDRKSFPELSPQRAEPYKYDLFLSHDWGEAGANHERVVAIATALKSHGFEVWLDEENLPAGEYIPSILQAAIDASRMVVVFVTKNYEQKVDADGNYCADEFRYALQKKGRGLMLPVVMEAAMSSINDWKGLLSFFLCGTKYISFYDDRKGVEDLVVEVTNHQGKSSSRQPSAKGAEGSIETGIESLCNTLRHQVASPELAQDSKAQLLAVLQPADTASCRLIRLATMGLRLLITRHDGMWLQLQH